MKFNTNSSWWDYGLSLPDPPPFLLGVFLGVVLWVWKKRLVCFFFQIVLLAAHLKRNDVSFWLKAGQLAFEQNNLSLAARCYSKGKLLNVAVIM